MNNIAHIVSTGEYSGAEKIAIEICGHLGNKYNFTYICKEGTLVDYLKDKKIRYITYKSTLELIKILKVNEFDLIHAHDYNASTISSVFSRNKVISHIHNNTPFAKSINMKSIIYYLASFRIEKILCVSNCIANEMYFKNRFSNKILITYNWINIKERLWKDEKKETDIIFIGRFTEQKNPMLFLEVIKEIINRYDSNIKVKMVGRGELLEGIKNFILKNLLTENIEIIDFNDKPHKYMSESKIFFVPSKWEGFGLVFLEALLNKCVVVATPVGGITEIFNESNEYLLNSKDEFVESIINILDNKCENEEYLIRNRKLVDKFDMNSNINKIKNIYDSII